MGIRLYAVIIIVTVIVRCPVFGGTDAAAFLNEGVGGRALAMGSAFVSVCDDPSAMYWNPAGLARIKRFSITTMSQTLGSTQWDTLQNITPSYQFMGVTVPVDFKGAGWVSNNTYAVGMIGSTLNNVNYTYLDASGQIVRDTFADTDNAYLLSWAVIVPGSNENLSVGATLTYITEEFSKISGASAKGYDADFGLLYSLNDNANVGLVIERGATLTWGNGSKDSSDITTKLGISNRFNLSRYLYLLGCLDVVQTKDLPMIANIGGEFGYEKKIGSEKGFLFEGVYLRFGLQGYALEDRNNSASQINENLNYTLGLGLDFSVLGHYLQFDYGLGSYALGQRDNISVSLYF